MLLLLCAANQCRLQDFINRRGYASLTRGSILVFSYTNGCGKNFDCCGKCVLRSILRYVNVHACVCVVCI